METDSYTASELNAEEAALYECLSLDGRDIAAYVVDGHFSFKGLQSRLKENKDGGSSLDLAQVSHLPLSYTKSAAECVTCVAQIGLGLLGTFLGFLTWLPEHFLTCLPQSMVSCKLTEEIHDIQAESKSATYIPLLERTGIKVNLQAARFDYPKLPKSRLKIELPNLGFYFSPARMRRIMTVVRSAVPGTFLPSETLLAYPQRDYPVLEGGSEYVIFKTEPIVHIVLNVAPQRCLSLSSSMTSFASTPRSKNSMQ